MLFSADAPPPLCDFPQYASMMLLRSAVDTRQRYDSSAALIVALRAQEYRLPVYKNPTPQLPRVRTFSKNNDNYTGKDHVVAMERWFKSSGLEDHNGRITHFKNHLDESWKKYIEFIEKTFLEENRSHATWEYIRDYFIRLTPDTVIIKKKLRVYMQIEMTSDESIAQLSQRQRYLLVCS